MERQTFEAWWRRNAGTQYPDVNWFERDAGGRYLNVGVYFAWQAWKARGQAGEPQNTATKIE